MKVLALDFGGSSVKYSVIGSDGSREKEGIAPAPTGTEADWVNCVKGLYEQFSDEVEGVAISQPGKIDPDTGFLSGGGAYFSLWGKNLFDLLRPAIPVPFTIMNDGKSAALAEAWNGALADVRDGVVLIIGTGLAGGVIINRELLMGHTFAAGEFSYMGVTPENGMMNSPMGTSSMAGLVTQASAALGVDIMKSEYGALFGGLKNVGAEMSAEDAPKFSPLNDDPRFEHGVNGKNFMELVGEGNEIAVALYEKFLKNVYCTLTYIQAILDPEVIAIGGGITHAPRFIPDMQKVVEDSKMGSLAMPINVRPCAVTGSPNEFGAAYHFFRTNGILQ